jgi:tRNA(fMet)-specific endonuclease VapC
VNLILDTNAVSAMLDGDPQIKPLVKGATQIHIPAIVIGEYRFGLLQSSRRSNYERSLERVMARAVVLNITESTASHYAEIRLQLKVTGTSIPVNDLWIAALCRQHNLPILTRDHHFDRVPGLQRQAW